MQFNISIMVTFVTETKAFLIHNLGIPAWRLIIFIEAVYSFPYSLQTKSWVSNLK